MAIAQETINHFASETQEHIRLLCEENSYHIDDAINYISEYGENNFVNHYEEYVAMGEQVGYDEVDYFCEVFGADQIDNFHLAYQGNYNQFEDFAKELFMSSHQIPEEIEFYIDWEKVSRDIGYDYYYDKKTGAVFSDI